MKSELERVISYKVLVQAGSGILTAINAMTEGEEMADLIQRQLAIIAQLAATLGITPKQGFEDYVENGVKLANANKKK